MNLILRLRYSILALFVGFAGFSQTTLNTTVGSTGYTGTNSSGTNSFITFVVENNSGGDIILTDVGNWTQSSDNGATVTLLATSTALSGAVGTVTPPGTIPTGWTVVTSASQSVSSTSLAVNPLLNNINFLIPNGSTYRFALHTTATNRYSGTGVGTCSPNTFTSAGVSLYVGDYQINGSYVGYASSNNPRFFTGSVSFIPAGPCINPPFVGNATATDTVPCAGELFGLGLDTATFGTGQTYQWLISSDNITYTPIAGATTASYNTTQSAPNYYKCVVTCGVSDTSGSVYVYSGPALLPLTEDFTGGTGNTTNPATPGCWAYYETPGHNGYGYTQSSTLSHSAPNRWYFYNSSNTTDTLMLISPEISGLSAGNKQVTFWMTSGTTSYGSEIVIGTVSGATGAGFIPLDTAVVNPGSAWTEFIVDVTTANGYNGTDSRIAFAYKNSVTFRAAYLDDILVDDIPLCPKPTFLNASNVTSTTATFSWQSTNNNFVLEWGPCGYVQGTGSTGLATSNTFAATGLLPATCYDYYVQSNCGVNGTSVWSGPYSFTTAFAPPYLEPINAYSPPTNPAGGWQEAQGNIANPTSFTSSTSGWLQDGFLNSGTTGAARELMSGTVDDEWTISPPIDLGTGSTSYQLEYDIATTTSGGTGAPTWGPDDSVMVVISTDGGATWNRTNALRVYSASNQPSNVLLHEVVDLTGYTGVVRFGFYVESTVTNASSDVFIDNIEVRIPPSCPEPFAIVVSAIGQDSAVVSWNASGNFNFEWGPSGFVQGTGTLGTVTNDSTVIITGLNPSTAYDFYIQTNCGSGLFSLWAGPTTFTTLCGDEATPYSMDFEMLPPGYNQDLANCWTSLPGATSTGLRWEAEDATGANENSTNTGPHFDNTTPAAAGGMYMYLETSSGSNGDTATLVTPPINLSSLTVPFIRFYYHMYGSTMGTLEVLAQGNSGSWDVLFSISGQQQSAGSDPFLEGGALLNNYTGQTVRLKIRGSRSSSFYGDMAIDDFEVVESPFCAFVNNDGTFTNVTSNNIDLSWSGVAASYNIEWGPAGFSQGSGAGYLINNYASTSLNVDTLSSNTCYDFYIQGNCAGGSGTSNWVGPFTVCTPCSPYTMPYLEDFTNWPPTCVEIDQGTNPWTNSGTWAMANFWSISTGTLIMDFPPILVSSTPYLEFKWSKLYSPSYPLDGLTVRARHISSNVWDTVWTAIGPALNSNDGAGNTTPGSGALVGITIPGFAAGDTLMLQFFAQADFGPNLYIDDVEVGPVPTCPNPGQGNTTSVTDVSATANWTVGGTAANSQVSYGAPGFSPLAGTIVTVSGTTGTANLTTLSSNTDYEWYVRDSCAVGDVSDWIGPYSFRTLCSPFTAPYYESWSSVGVAQTGSLNNCWTLGNGASSTGFRWETEDASGANENSTGTGPFYDNTTFGSAGGMYIFLETSSGTTGDSAFVESPLFDLTGLTDPELSFYYHMYGATTGTLSVDIWNNGVWTNNAFTISGQQQTAGNAAWNRVGVSLTGYTGTIKVRFGGTRGTSFTGDMSLDDIRVDNSPNCNQPYALGATAITENSASIFFTDSIGATAWAVEYGTSGFTQGTGTLISATNDTIALTSLAPASEYCFYVAAICPGTTDTSFWSGPYCFTTLCPSQFPAPYTDDFEVLAPGVFNNFDNCWVSNKTTGLRWESEDATGANENSTATGPFFDNTTPSTPGGMYMYLETSSGTTGDTAGFITPGVNISTLTNPQVTFFYHMYGATTGRLDILANDGAGWVLVDSIVGQQQTAGSDPWLFRSVPLNNLTGSVVKVKFRGQRGSSFTGDISLDDVTIEEAPACPEPLFLQQTANTNTSATLEWTSTNGTSWEIEYGPGGFAPGTGTVVTSTTDSVVITGLATNLLYEAYVRAYCSGTDTSTWAGPVEIFSTTVPCDDFDAYVAGDADSQSSLINGWAGAGGDGLISTAQFNSAPNSLKISDDDPAGFADIVMNIGTYTSGIWNVKFDMYIPTNYDGYYNILHNYTGATNVWAIEVNLSNTGVATVEGGTNSAVVLGTYNFNMGQWNTIEHIIDLDADTAYIRVNGANANLGWVFSLNSTNFGDQFNAVNFYSNNSNGETPLYYVDNFCVQPGGCVAPSSVTISDTLCDELEVDWTGVGGAGIVQYGPTGFTPGTGTFVQSTAPATITGLTANTTYDIWVADTCNGDTTSYTGPITVTTNNGPLPTPGFTYVISSFTPASATIDFTGTGGGTYSWDFGNGSTGTGQNTSVTYTANGTYTVTLTVTDGCGTATTSQQVLAPIGVENPELAASLRLFPNPTKGDLELSLLLSQTSDVTVSLVNAAGALAMETTLEEVNGSVRHVFNLAHLPKGMYLIRIQTAQGYVVRRVVLQ